MNTSSYRVQDTINSFKVEMGCQLCGYKKTHHALVLYPLDQRSFPLEQAAARVGRSADDMIDEIKKCTVLCRNCQKEVKYEGVDASACKRVSPAKEDYKWFVQRPKWR